MWVDVIRSPQAAELGLVDRLSRGQLRALSMMRALVVQQWPTRARRNRLWRDLDGKQPETATRPCLCCCGPFESEGVYLRRCLPCKTVPGR